MPLHNERTGFIRSLFLLILLFSLFVQLSTAAESNKHCLWKVKGERNTVYLLGSVHLLKENHYPLPEPFEKAFNDADRLVFEVNLDSSQSPSAQQFILNRCMLKNGQTLKSLLTDSTFNQATELCSSNGLNIMQFQNFKPWFFTLTVMVVKLQQMGFKPELGVDYYYFNKGKAAGKELLNFETAEYQISLFDSLSGHEQEMMIQQVIREINIYETYFNDITRFWSEGRTADLEKLLLESFRDYPALYQRLLVNRNRNWLNEIEKYLQQDVNYLIIGGAGHMVGQEGIIRMLSQKGYQVDQL